MNLRFTSLLAVMAATAGGLAFITSAPSTDEVHEWGTFTSVASMNGQAAYWSATSIEPLPSFVYTPANEFEYPPSTGPDGRLFVGKRAPWKIRMETPVLYFYGQPRSVQLVRAGLEHGEMTEWYPWAKRPAADSQTRQPADKKPTYPGSVLEWKDIALVPSDASQLKPGDGNHYFAARETDSLDVMAKNAKGQPEREKFLFYRGAAMFEPPVEVNWSGANKRTLSIKNTATSAMPVLFVMSMKNDTLTWHKEQSLAAGKEVTMALDTLQGEQRTTAPVATLMTELKHELVKAGLHEREATAMVKTWETKWFQGEGVRLLYIVPRAYVDQVVPLTITPKPAGLERVYVGRVEVMTPDTLSQIKAEITTYRYGDSRTQAAVKARLEKMGARQYFGFTDCLDIYAEGAPYGRPAKLLDLAPVLTKP